MPLPPGSIRSRAASFAGRPLALAVATTAALALALAPPARAAEPGAVEAVKGAARAIAAAADSITSGRPSALPPDSARLTFRPYMVRSLDGSERPAELGRLVVPELRSRRSGRSIGIVFLLFRTTSTTPSAPVVVLPGGPGYPGTLLARTPAYLRLFERLREQSDVLVMDQRGAGLSEPTLQCATKSSLPFDAFESEAKTAGALGGMVRPCVKLIRGDGHAIEAFTTGESVEDLEDLRRALGASKLRLIGASYGTELALEMIRRHGDRIESAVLVGTRGPDMAWRLPATTDLQLARLAALVAADPKWTAAMPDLVGAVRQVLERLAWKPASVSIVDAKTGQNVRVRAGAAALQAIVGSDLSDWSRGPLLPAMFASLARGDSTLFARRIGDLMNSTAAGISVMQVATDCASGASPERRSLVARQAKTALLGNMKNVLVNPAFCDLVGSGDLGPAFREPVSSSVPTLFLTGTMDGITPPFQAEEVRWGFPRGIHLLVENGWHEVLPFSDAQQTIADFFAGQDVRGRRLALPTPTFLSIDEAKALTAPRGR